jgi:hypothetical protein
MFDRQLHEHVSEYYEVVKVVELVAEVDGVEKTIRIEAQMHENERGVRYRTRGWFEESFTIQPTYPQTGGEFDRTPESVSVWVDARLPWTDCDSADEAISQVIGFLR